MKMTLKEKVDRSQELLTHSDFQKCMHWNNLDVVFYASAMVGSHLDKRHNDILMNRNAVPRHWRSNVYLSDYKINSAFKKAYVQVVGYIKHEFDITPSRILKLLDILSDGLPIVMERRLLTKNNSLQRYLRKLNDLRTHCKEMTDSEIYDFSFEMMYDLIDMLSLSNATLSLSFLIMYWIQRENKMLPLALKCNTDEFLTVFNIQAEDTFDKKESRKEFRLFMRKVLDLHLREFLKSNDNNKKETSRDRILDLIKSNSKYTAKTMASCLGLSVQAIQKQIAMLKTEGRLQRIGPDNGGYWNVIEGHGSFI